MNHEVFHRPLSQLNVRRAVYVDEDLPVREAILLMQSRDEPCVLVGDSSNTVGILTERDLLTKVANKGDDRLGEKVSVFMTPEPTSLASDALILDALQAMASGGYRHLPLTEDDAISGVISVADIVDFLVIHFPEEILNPWFDIKPGDSYG